MRIVFFGTSAFAAEILSFLLSNGIDVVAVVTQRDKKRHKIPVKELVRKNYPDTPLFQPEKASAPQFINDLTQYQADLFVVVAYGQILKQELLDVPHKGCINVHASLLPKYRGAAPIQRCIMGNEAKAGITIMKMVAKLDAGDMIATSSTPLDDKMTFSELEEILCDIAKPLLMQVINMYKEGVVESFAQEESLATYAAKISSEERHINWNMPAVNIHNLIRSLSKIPGAYCWIMINNEKKRLKILRSQVVEKEGVPGEVLVCDKNQLVIACEKQALQLLEVQLEGKRAMCTEDFITGVKEKFQFTS